MIIRFRTETGSIYKLDTLAMTWKRTHRAGDSGSIRQESGLLLSVPEVQFGQQVLIEDSTVRPGFDGHIVMTSRVTAVYSPIGEN